MLESATQQQKQQITEQEYRIEKLKWEVTAQKRLPGRQTGKLFGGNQAETLKDEQLQLSLVLLEAERSRIGVRAGWRN